MDLTKCVTFGELGRLRDFSTVNLHWSQVVGTTITVSDNTLYVMVSGSDYETGTFYFNVIGNKTFAYTSLYQYSNPVDYMYDIKVAGVNKNYREYAWDEAINLVIYDFMEIGDNYFCTSTSYSEYYRESARISNISKKCWFSWLQREY